MKAFYLLFAIVSFVWNQGNLVAVQGTFPTGYGARSVGMGGTAAANPQESLVLASNPAGISFLCDRVDLDLQWFNPHRGYSYTGSDTIPGDSVISQRNDFFIPAAGILKHYDETSTLGLGIYASGVNVTYPRDNPVFGDGNIAQLLVLDYMELFCAPTYSYSITENQAIGVSLVASAQRIRIKGLQGFAAFSSSPNNVSNNGFDWAYGAGVRIGWMGQVFDGVTLGFSYATKVYMNKFHKYKGLLAHQGQLNVPANLLAGISWQVTDALLVAFDYQRIFFGDVPPLAHSITRLAPGNLGTNAGAGFGWKDVSYYKIGANYCVNPCWEVRAGYGYGKIPFSSIQVDPNIMAPLTTKHHISVGTTYYVPAYCGHWDLAFVYGVKGERKGDSLVGLGRVKEHLYQYCLYIQYGFEI